MKHGKKVMAAALAGLMLSASGIAMAATALVKDIRVQMGGIQVVVLGKQLEMKDASGATVEPIIYNGTTYLPVRSVAEAVGLEANWDGNTSTVSLGGKTVFYLDEMPATNFESTTTGESKYKSLGKTNVAGTTFSRGLSLKTGIAGDKQIGDSEVTTIYYTLDGSYQRFLATVDVISEGSINETIVRIYGDGTLLYTSPGIVQDSLAYDVDLEIKGVTKLSIELTSTSGTDKSWDIPARELLFGEARLIK